MVKEIEMNESRKEANNFLQIKKTIHGQCVCVCVCVCVCGREVERERERERENFK